ncbi:MAG: radical SAM protein, partial [Candidatus Thorarchaeota archaeon]
LEHPLRQSMILYLKEASTVMTYRLVGMIKLVIRQWKKCGVKTDSKIGLLTSLTSFRLIRHFLVAITRNCMSDGDTRLNVALDLIAGKRDDACRLCRISAYLTRLILAIGARAFGTTSDDIERGLEDNIFRRSMSSIVSGLAKFGVTRPFTPGAPFQVVWNVTRACNLKCKHCYESAGQKDQNELSTNEALECVDKLADAGVVFLAFSGGEPTIRPDILRLIRRATERGIYVAVATNGISFSNPERVKRFKNAGMKFVQISVDGANADTHDNFRGVSGAFERTIRGIKNCVSEGLFVEISTTVTRHNISEIHDVITLSESLKARWLMLYNLVPVGRGAELIDLDLTPDEREHLLEELWKRASSKEKSSLEVLTTAPQFGRVASDANLLCTNQEEIISPTHFNNTRIPKQMQSLTEFIGGCGAGRFYVALEPNGDIYPCVFFPHIDSMKIGNIVKEDFDSLWTHSALLQRLRNKDLLRDACGSCEKRHVCGGCRARAIAYFGDELAPDPGCIHNKDYWDQLVGSCTSDLEVLLRASNSMVKPNFVEG